MKWFCDINFKNGNDQIHEEYSQNRTLRDQICQNTTQKVTVMKSNTKPYCKTVTKSHKNKPKKEYSDKK